MPPSTPASSWIALGAVLRYAVTATVSGISIQAIGLILIIVGVADLSFESLSDSDEPARPVGDDLVA